jgi:hypothetical protein
MEWTRLGPENFVSPIALIVLCVEVDENPATRNHLWILVGMILVSLGTEFANRKFTGQGMVRAQRAAVRDTQKRQ